MLIKTGHFTAAGHRVQELCESRGGRPGLPVLMSHNYGFCGRKATLNHAYRHWSQSVPNTSTRHPRTLSSTSSSSTDALRLEGFQHWSLSVTSWRLVERSVSTHVRVLFTAEMLSQRQSSNNQKRPQPCRRICDDVLFDARKPLTVSQEDINDAIR